jgi:hypothetical protein
VIDPRTGATVGEQRDDGMCLVARCWSPVPGDQRLAFDHERKGHHRPAIWDLSTGERCDLRLDLDGEVWVQDWWPDERVRQIRTTLDFLARQVPGVQAAAA